MTMSAIMKIKVQGMKTAPRMRPNFSFGFILKKRETRELEKVLHTCHLILNIWSTFGAWLRGIYNAVLLARSVLPSPSEPVPVHSSTSALKSSLRWCLTGYTTKMVFGTITGAPGRQDKCVYTHSRLYMLVNALSVWKVFEEAFFARSLSF